MISSCKELLKWFLTGAIMLYCMLAVLLLGIFLLALLNGEMYWSLFILTIPAIVLWCIAIGYEVDENK